MTPVLRGENLRMLLQSAGVPMSPTFHLTEIDSFLVTLENKSEELAKIPPEQRAALMEAFRTLEARFGSLWTVLFEAARSDQRGTAT